MWVFKLGGSLYSNPTALKLWIAQLEKLALHTPIVITPGGGLFADQVRLAQTHHSLSNETAHEMALLAMAQFGLLLSNYSHQSKLINHPDNYSSSSHKLQIWLPNTLLFNEPALEKSWDITSDSLALWFSQKIDADKLILIKSIKSSGNTLKSLSDHSIIDRGFINLYLEKPIASYITHSDEHQNIVQLISSETRQLR
jgi:aspartokinase-like uncharacterized kinase